MRTAQIWQWIKHGAKTVEGKRITIEYFEKLLKEELSKIYLINNKDNNKVKEASVIFKSMCVSSEFEEFLTLPAYKFI